MRRSLDPCRLANGADRAKTIPWAEGRKLRALRAQSPSRWKVTDREKRLHENMSYCAWWFVGYLSVCSVTSWTLVQGQLLNLDYVFFPVEPRDIDLYI